jgi:hypothetical protein
VARPRFEPDIQPAGTEVRSVAVYTFTVPHVLGAWLCSETTLLSMVNLLSGVDVGSVTSAYEVHAPSVFTNEVKEKVKLSLCLIN